MIPQGDGQTCCHKHFTSLPQLSSYTSQDKCLGFVPLLHTGNDAPCVGVLYCLIPQSVPYNDPIPQSCVSSCLSSSHSLIFAFLSHQFAVGFFSPKIKGKYETKISSKDNIPRYHQQPPPAQYFAFNAT